MLGDHALPEALFERILDLLDGSRTAREVDRAVEALCAAHPEHADALREEVRRAWADGEDGRTGGMPDQVGPYRLLEEIGRGGMGTVYRAEQHEPVKRQVALKVVQQGLATKDVLARFEIERRALAAMGHSCIAKVFDAGATEQGLPFFVMELVEGLPITEYCDQNKLSLPERLKLFQKICQGVQHAHQKGVIHRDLKPGNVLVVREGTDAIPKILDFGLAKATNRDFLQVTQFTEKDRVLGTLEYMSPEQAAGDGEVIDARSDIYSLGVMLYELLSGELPFPTQVLRRAGALEALRLIREEEPQKPSTRLASAASIAAAAPRRGSVAARTRALKGDLDWIVMCAMAKEPERRYDAAVSLAADIGRYLNDEPVMAGPPSATYRLRKFVRKHRGPLLTTAAILITALVGTIAAVHNASVAQAAQATAEERKKEGFRLVTAANLATLMASQADLWPIAPDSAPRMEAWVRDATKLTDALPELRADLRELRSRGNPVSGPAVTPGGEATPEWTFPPDDMVTPWWHERLVALIRGLEELQAGLLAESALVPVHGWSVPRRLAMVHELQEAFSPDGSATRAWREALPSIRQCYPGLDLGVQLGLVPIGPDPKSGWWEFAHLASGTAPARGPSGELRLEDESAIVLVLLPGGTFLMGASPDDALAEDWERPQHEVELGPFFLGKYEVTQAQWHRLSGDTPSYFAAGKKDMGWFVEDRLHPVESIDWERARSVLARAALELPTEAQWEYAARAGTTTRWWSGDSAQSIVDARGVSVRDRLYRLGNEEVIVSDGLRAHGRVDRLTPNPWGFHMMYGNVFEWCYDAAGDGFYARSPRVDPVCRDDTPYHRTRGSSHSWELEWTRSSARKAELGTTIVDYIGVRAMRPITP